MSRLSVVSTSFSTLHTAKSRTHLPFPLSVTPPSEVNSVGVRARIDIYIVSLLTGYAPPYYWPRRKIEFVCINRGYVNASRCPVRNKIRVLSWPRMRAKRNGKQRYIRSKEGTWNPRINERQYRSNKLLSAEIENPHSMLAPRINVPYSQPSLIYLARCPIVDVSVYRETKVFENSEMLAANTQPWKNSPRNFSYLASSLSFSRALSLLFIPIRRVLCPPFGYTMSFALISG